MLKDILYSTSLPIIMDGAIGSYLQSLKELHSDKPECNSFFVSLMHQNYIDAGAKIIRTNTFNLGNIALREDYTPAKLKEQLTKNIDIANEAKASNKTITLFGVVGPLFFGHKDQRISTYMDIVHTFMEKGIEYLYFETITSNKILREIIEALQRIRISKSLSINLSFTTKENAPLKLISGDSIEDTVDLIKEITQIATVGLNCISLRNISIVRQNLTYLKEKLHIPLSLSPSLGVPDTYGCYPLSIKETLCYIENLISDIDLKIIGGCCGTHPSFTKQLNSIHILNKNNDLYL